MKATPVFWVAVVFGIELAVTPFGRGESFTFSTAAGFALQSPTLGMTGDGTNSNARFRSPTGIAVDSTTNVYITDSSAIRKMARVGTNWVVTTLAGDLWVSANLDGTNNSAKFNGPAGIALDSAGTIFFAYTLNNAIRKVTQIGTNWVVTTIAGLAGSSNQGSVDGSNNVARFNHPHGVALDNAGTLFVADTVNNTIRKIVLSGTNWVVTTIAGQAGTTGAWDGSNNIARFNGPIAMAVDRSGSFYVADFNNNTIRKGTPLGTNWAITTIAGSAIAPPGAADGINSNARFYQPQGITLDASNNLYVSEAGNMGVEDVGNNTIRKIKSAGTNWVVSTIAGLAQTSGSTDGTGTSARFNNPFGAAVTPSGNLFIADSWNMTIRNGQAGILLDYKVLGNKLVLSWPISATGFVAEASSSLTGLWIPQTGVVTNGDTLSLTNTLGPGNVFFRLHKP